MNCQYLVNLFLHFLLLNYQYSIFIFNILHTHLYLYNYNTIYILKYQSHKNKIYMQSQQPFNHKSIRNKVIFLALYFGFLAATVSSFNNVIIYMHEKYRHMGYGQSYLTANSVAMIVSLFVGPYLIKKVFRRYHRVLVFCALIIGMSFLVPMFFTIPELQLTPKQIRKPTNFRFLSQILANFFNGFSYGISVILQGVFLGKICQPIEKNKGRYFSLYSLVLSIRGILGPVITMFALGRGNEPIYYFTLCCAAMISASIASLFINRLKQEDSNHVKQTKCLVDLWSFVYQMKHFIASFIFYGLMMGTVSSSLLHLLPKANNPNENDSNIGIVLLFFGIGGLIGGPSCGIIFDKLQWKKTCNIGFILFLLSLILEIFLLSTNHSIVGTCFCSFFLGLAITYINCFFMMMITIFFRARPEAFAIYRQINLIFYTLYPWIAVSISKNLEMDQSMIYQSIFLIALGLISAMSINIFNYQRRNIQFKEFQDEIQIQTEAFNMPSQPKPTQSDSKIQVKS